MSSKICLWCGKELPKHRRKYCSDECSHAYFVNKIAPLWWNNAKRIHLEKAGYKCELCGSAQKLELHHKNKLDRNESYHNSPKNHQDNLIALCRNCHEEQHHKQIRNIRLAIKAQIPLLDSTQ